MGKEWEKEGGKGCIRFFWPLLQVFPGRDGFRLPRWSIGESSALVRRGLALVFRGEGRLVPSTAACPRPCTFPVFAMIEVQRHGQGRQTLGEWRKRAGRGTTVKGSASTTASITSEQGALTGAFLLGLLIVLLPNIHVPLLPPRRCRGQIDSEPPIHRRRCVQERGGSGGGSCTGSGGSRYRSVRRGQ